MKRTIILSVLLAVMTLMTFPVTAPAPPSAVQVGCNDYYSHMAETYGVKVMPKVETGTVADPVLLNSHGFEADRGDAVQIQDVGGGRVKLLHPKSGRSVVVKLPVKK